MKEYAAYFSNIYYLTLFVVAIIAVLLLKKYKDTPVKYFIYFLVYVLILEIVAAYPRHIYRMDSLAFLRENKFFNNNFWYYTIFWSIGSSIFFCFYYQKILKNKLFNKILNYGIKLFLFVSFVSIAFHFEQLFTPDFVFISYINSALILICVVFYFLEVLSSNKILSFYKDVNFYISSAIFIWCCILVTISIYSEYYTVDDLDYVYLQRIILACTNIFMYTTFAIGLIVSKPKKEDYIKH